MNFRIQHLLVRQNSSKKREFEEIGENKPIFFLKIIFIELLQLLFKSPLLIIFTEKNTYFIIYICSITSGADFATANDTLTNDQNCTHRMLEIKV
jgi:hypothetical protein